MCGRFVLTASPGDIADLLDVEEGRDLGWEPRWNIPPTSTIPIIVDTDRSGTRVRRLALARWGLVPQTARSVSGPPLFNARSEKAAHTVSFRASTASRRAVVPATGYYEWRVTPEGRDPVFIHDPAGTPLLFAGLYSWWSDPAVDGPERWLLSTTILTRAAPPALAEIHDRAPVVLSRDAVDAWLDPARTVTQNDVDAVAAQAEEQYTRFAARPVDRAVGSVRNDGPELLRPLS